MPSEPRFLADRMLGKLARMLRMVGHDVAYAREGTAEEALARAESEGRIFLTRKRRLSLAPAAGLQISSNYPFHQAREVIQTYALQVRTDFSRCTEDNTPLEDLDQEAAAGRVPPLVLEQYDEFKSCPSCQRVYWGGAHVEGMKTLITALSSAPLADDVEEVPDAPSTTLEPLLDLHQALEVMFLDHRVALMQADLPRARRSFRRFAAWMKRHVSDENSLVLPVYREQSEPFERGASPDIFENEHTKILDHLERIEDTLEALEREPRSEDALRVSCLALLDREKLFVDLCEHHDRRERLFLYPALDGLLSDVDKQELLIRMVGRTLVAEMRGIEDDSKTP